jgi:hypothetical protein
MTDSLPRPNEYDEILSRPKHPLRQLPIYEDEADESSPAPWLIGRSVTLKDPIAKCQSYGRPGMRARVLKVRKSGERGNHIVTLDFEEFEVHNKPLESFDWQDSGRIACLTAREAGEYQGVEDYVFSSNEDLADIMEPIDASPAASLLRLFRKTGRPNSDYVSWLEERLVELCPELIQEEAAPEGPE